MMFDAFAIVDWSAATVPRTGRDSIWICWHEKDGERLENPPTRHAAKTLLENWLAAALERRERVLLGFDFPFGYPAGFAARLGLSGRPWRAIWDEIAHLLRDDERNANNRFEVADALNQRVSGGPFPFWGCPPGNPRAHLGSKHHRGHDSGGLAERRLVDMHIPSAQPCWKLLGAGSVGGQALTGIPVVRALRDDPRWIDRVRIWPFETGLQAPEQGAVVIAEVYPSLWAVSPAAGEPKDAAQVRSVARFFATSDGSGELAALFAGDPSLTREQRHRVETEEAWTLGVTTARQRPISISPATPHPDPFAAPPLALPRKYRERDGGPSRSEQLMLELDGYEGPIDLLLALAREQKVDLGKISILALADQYLAFIARQRSLSLEIAADYLVMAAWLAYLKSRLLLPQAPQDEEPSGTELAAQLEHRLRLLEGMQIAGGRLMARPRTGQDVLLRGAPEGLAVIPVPAYELALYELLRAYGEGRRRTQAAVLAIEPAEFYSMDDALNRLARFIGRAPNWRELASFLPRELRGEVFRRSALAATFAATLELARDGRIELRQDRAFGPIYLRSTGPAAAHNIGVGG